VKIVGNKDIYPACVKDILENGLKVGGKNRHYAALALIGFFKDSGYSERETLNVLHEWHEKVIGSNDGDRKLRDRDKNAATSVKTIFSDNNYHFGCQFMLGLKGKGPADRVACVGIHRCPIVAGKTAEEKVRGQEPARIPIISLAQVTSPVYDSKVIKTIVHVSGKTQGVYRVPKIVTMTCLPNLESEMCVNCRNSKFIDATASEVGQARQTKEFTEKDRELLAMIACTDEQ
jgi:DNA primase large subunit